MQEQIRNSFKTLLIIAVAVGVILSGNFRSLSHDVTDLAKIVAQHHAEIKEHGHAHEDIIDLMHAYHGHAHEIADHDHNIAFLPPRDAISTPVLTSKGWTMSDNVMRDRRDYGLDRPPRV